MTNEFLAFAPISAAAPMSAAPMSAAALPVAVPPAPATLPVMPALPGLDPATALLDDLMARVGVDGLTAAFADPGVLAQVDQHAAAVRDALASADREADADGLAAYAKSIVFAARRMGRDLPEPGEAHLTRAAWHRADWHLLRLLAVCMIADAAGLL
jgi:hypothetical protein